MDESWGKKFLAQNILSYSLRYLKTFWSPFILFHVLPSIHFVIAYSSFMMFCVGMKLVSCLCVWWYDLLHNLTWVQPESLDKWPRHGHTQFHALQNTFEANMLTTLLDMSLMLEQSNECSLLLILFVKKNYMINFYFQLRKQLKECKCLSICQSVSLSVSQSVRNAYLFIRFTSIFYNSKSYKMKLQINIR